MDSGRSIRHNESMQKARALSVHLLTASGAVFAMLAMLAAVEANWAMMFLWLLVALVVDGIDGPLARRYNVTLHAARYDGVLLDLIIDYLTYAFIPAYALYASGMVPGWLGWGVLIVIPFTSAMYFADTRMKTLDKSFLGFPSCWNMVALLCFVLTPAPGVIFAAILALALAMFVPLKFVHPTRTKRWRTVTLPVACLWIGVGIWATWVRFDLPDAAALVFALCSAYLLLAGIAHQVIRKPQTSGASSAS
jgi:phosphatidylcholine synthase